MVRLLLGAALYVGGLELGSAYSQALGRVEVLVWGLGKSLVRAKVPSH